MTKTESVPQVNTWYDASNKGDPTSKGRAIGGHIVYIGNSPIEWKSTMNTHPGQSAQHNEYQALASASKATAWVRHLLQDMGLGAWTSGPTPLLGDNNAAITLARNDILTTGNRFYTPDLHYAKDAFETGITCPRKVATDNNISDAMTKNTPTATFQRHVEMICGYEALPTFPGPPRK